MSNNPTFFIDGMTNTPNTQIRVNNNIQKKDNRNSVSNEPLDIIKVQEKIANEQENIMENLEREQRKLRKKQKWKERKERKRQQKQQMQSQSNKPNYNHRMQSQPNKPNYNHQNNKSNKSNKNTFIPPGISNNNSQITIKKITDQYTQLLNNLKRVEGVTGNAGNVKTMQNLIIKLYKYIKDLNETFALPASERMNHLNNLIQKFKSNRDFSNKMAVVIALNQNDKLNQKNYQYVIKNNNTNRKNNQATMVSNLSEVLGQNIENLEGLFGNNKSNNNSNNKSNNNKSNNNSNNKFNNNSNNKSNNNSNNNINQNGNKNKDNKLNSSNNLF